MILNPGDKVILDGKLISELDLREPTHTPSGEPMVFSSPRFYCGLCNKKIFHEPIIYKKDGKWLISGEHTFHYYDTHGIPPELLDEALGIGEIIKLLAKGTK